MSSLKKASGRIFDKHLKQFQKSVNKFRNILRKTAKTVKSNPKVKKTIIPFVKQLLKYNRPYRILVLLVWMVALMSATTSLADGLLIFTLGVLPAFFITLLVTDSKFKAYMERKSRKQKLAEKKEVLKRQIKSKEEKEMVSDMIKILPMIILYKFLPFLTRLPILEDYFQSSLGHYRHRHLRQLVSTLEGSKKPPKIQIQKINLNQYYATLFFIWIKPLNAIKTKKILLKRTASFLGKPPHGVILRIKKRQHGELLIPIENIQGEEVF